MNADITRPSPRPPLLAAIPRVLCARRYVTDAAIRSCSSTLLPSVGDIVTRVATRPHTGIGVTTTTRTPELARSVRFARRDATRRNVMRRRAFDGTRSPVNAQGERRPGAPSSAGGNTRRYAGTGKHDRARSVAAGCVHAMRCTRALATQNVENPEQILTNTPDSASRDTVG